jgi:tRNA pseudouridine55 synthase
VQTAHPLNGVLVVDKPGRGDSLPPVERRQRTEQSNEPRPARLPTSHDVVDWVRRWSGQRRIGHTGTLDPMASGVLLLCLGNATRLVEYYQGETKSYAAGVTLGSATDTYDAEGQTVATAPVPPLAAEAIRTALARFTGEIRQRPPVYSAIKQGGENLYEKARRGESGEAPERTVTIHQLRLETWQPPDRINLWVDCSAGTYVRSLAVDLAVALGTVGHLAALRRERVGEFTLAHAHSWQQIQEAARGGVLNQLLLPLGAGLPLPQLAIDDDQARALGFGQGVALPVAAGSTQPLAVARWHGACAGIIRCFGPAQSGAWLWRAEKWLN